MGRSTYEIFGKDEAFAGLNTVVLSGTTSFDGVKTVTSLQEMLQYLANKGHSQAFVVGGVSLHNAMIAEGVVDELYINIEPYIAKGLFLGPSDNKLVELEMIGHKHIGAGIIQIHYRVV